MESIMSVELLLGVGLIGLAFAFFKVAQYIEQKEDERWRR